MYKLLKNKITGSVDYVIRLSDNAQIPMSQDNTDYQQYLKWVEAGNTPISADGE